MMFVPDAQQEPRQVMEHTHNDDPHQHSDGSPLPTPTVAAQRTLKKALNPKTNMKTGKSDDDGIPPPPLYMHTQKDARTSETPSKDLETRQGCMTVVVIMEFGFLHQGSIFQKYVKDILVYTVTLYLSMSSWRLPSFHPVTSV